MTEHETGEVIQWIERTLALPIYQNPAKDSYGEGVVETLRTVQKIIKRSARKHPEPEITDEMVERGAEAISEMHSSSFVGDWDRQTSRAVLIAALRVPVGEGEQ